MERSGAKEAGLFLSFKNSTQNFQQKNFKPKNQQKTLRGYVPTFTRSMHCLRERSHDAAVAQFLRSEAREVEYALEAMSSQMSPYKK